MVRVGCVVNYCTNDYRFLKPCLDALRLMSSNIIVSVCDHLFHGEEEDRELLHRSYAEHPDVQFVEFAYDPKILYGIYSTKWAEDTRRIRHWHSTARYVGFYHLPKDIEYVFFIDVDEIVDGVRLLEVLEKNETSELDAMLFSSYVYLGNEKMRAVSDQNYGLMIKRALLEPELLFDAHERHGFFLGFHGKKHPCIKGLDGLPLIHHYNWVRSEQELQKKVLTWGHKFERDWLKLIKENRLQEATGYAYTACEKIHDILQVDVEDLKRENFFSAISNSHFPHVFNRDIMVKKVIELHL